MTNDLVSDMFTRIRNAKLCEHKIVTLTSTKVTRGIARVLFSEGILDDIEENVPIDGINYLILSIKYKGRKIKKPTFQDIQRISKPGGRKYTQARNIPRFKGGLATIIISTSEGVMTGKEAKKKKDWWRIVRLRILI
jgi:small subunit ribosomal protein S8